MITQHTESVLYFVYGWQLDAELLARYCPSARFVATARLPDYDIGFFGHTPKWDGAEEALAERKDGEVWGLVLELSWSNAERMDGMQNVHDDGSGIYFHYPADVEGTDGSSHEVLLYKRNMLGEPRAPSAEYRDRIVAGALAHGLPAAYVDRLRGIAAHPAGYPVPHNLRPIRIVLSSANCNC
jgi:gamma-glutamylcyclotransferase